MRALVLALNTRRPLGASPGPSLCNVAGRQIPPATGGNRVVVSASFDPDEPVEAVLEAAAAHPELDVVVTDLVMNDVDGMEILHQAKKTLPEVATLQR